MADTLAKILIVDDEEDITIAIADYFNRHELGIEPTVTNDPRRVFPILAEQNDIRLILSDFRMPAINGLDLLLRVKSQYPNVKFIIMTGYGTPELRKEGLKRGAIRYIEKPFDISELSRIVQEVLSDTPAGFGGMIESVQLEDIIQLIGLGQRTVSLNVTANEGQGVCYFVDGEIIHAHSGSFDGEEAFYEIFNWTGGQFALASLEEKPEQTIVQSWQGLLLEAARRQDEANARKEDLMEDDEPAMADDSFAITGESDFSDTGLDLLHLEPDAEDTLPEPEVDLIESESSFDINDDSSEGFDLFHLVSEETQSLDEDIIPVPEMPESAPPSPTSPALSEKLIGEALESAVNHYMLVWPENKEKVAFSSLPLSRLSVNVRRHLFYRFHQLSMKVIHTEGVPFDFSNDKVISAVRNLLQVLRENWMITNDSFRKMIHDAIRFDLARSIDPARAIAQFLQESTDGDAVQMKSLLRALIEHELVDSFFESLLEDLDKWNDRRIHPRKVENFARAILDRRDENSGFKATRDAMKRIFDIAGQGKKEKPQHIHINVLISMLESRGLAHVADFIRADKKTARKAMSLEDLDSLMKSFKYFTGHSAR